METMSKNKIILLGVLALASVTPFSCVRIEGDGLLEDKRAILYNIAPVKTLPHTKAITVFPTSDTFGSYAYIIPKGKTYDYNSNEGDIYIDNAEISYNSSAGHWKCEGKMYSWPTDGSSLTFFSYAPYDLPGLSCSCGEGIRIDDFTVNTTLGNAESHTDILIAVIAKDKTSNDGNGVPTIFQHKLSRVEIVATLNNELESGEYAYIKSLKLNNIYTSGDYIDGGWTNYSGRQNYQNTGMAQVDLTYGSQSVILPKTVMMPQPMTSASNAPSITIVYRTHNHSSEQTQTIPLYNGPATAAAWEPGKDITYHINISTKDEYIDFDGVPSEWMYQEGGDLDLGNK